MRLIDADADALIVRINNSFGSVTRYIIKSILKDTPTIEAEPVRHGRWVPTPEYDSCWCSCCKKQYTGFFASDWNYCPHCGAKMQE